MTIQYSTQTLRNAAGYLLAQYAKASESGDAATMVQLDGALGSLDLEFLDHGLEIMLSQDGAKEPQEINSLPEVNHPANPWEVTC